MDLTTSVLFARDLDKLGIALPKQARLVLDLQEAALAAAGASPADDLAAGLLDGTLTPVNVRERLHAAALQATAQEKAHELLRDLTLPARRTFATAIEADAPRLLRDLRKVFLIPAKKMQKAGELIPTAATAEQVLNAAPEAATAYREMAKARDILDAVRSVRVALARDYKIGNTHTLPLLFTVGIDSALSLARAKEAWDRPSNVGGVWHALAAAGFTLDLPDPDQTKAAQLAISASEESERERERQARTDELKANSKGWAWPTPVDAA